jgi:hypothetical protein
MTPYWVLFSLPLLGVLMPAKLDARARWVAWSGFALVVAFMVGLRHEVGGDWGPYLEIYEDLAQLSFLESLQGRLVAGDPGYNAFNWLSAQFGWGIYGANLFCGLIFVAGFSAFARRQPHPWLAWVVALPYLVIVVVMGYSRQGVAVGLVFAAMASIDQRRIGRFVLLIAFAVLFHKSAAVMLPFGFVLQERRTALRTVAFAGALLAAAMAFLYAHLETFYASYIDYRQESEGALVRVVMNLLPAAILLFTPGWRRRFPEIGHWRYIAIASIAAVFLVPFASTAVDRIALYLAPIQVYVWCRFPLLFADRALRTAVVLSISAVYAAVLWVWLVLGNFSAYWLPYKTVLL